MSELCVVKVSEWRAGVMREWEEVKTRKSGTETMAGAKRSVETLKGSERVLLGFRLTSRELDLLEFVLDQKFAGIDALYQRFFTSDSSKSTRYAAERIQLLRRHGFLRAENVYTQPKLFYVASPLAKDVLQSLRPGRRQLDPIESIDARTFEHDSRVTLCRAHREGADIAREWVSERRLKAEWAGALGKLAREYCPDGVYTNRRGEKVAFELELSPKTRERHAKKISRFLDVMRDSGGAFQRTLFVACDPGVKATLEGLTKPYPEQFKVLSFEQVVSPARDGTTPRPSQIRSFRGGENHVRE